MEIQSIPAGFLEMEGRWLTPFTGRSLWYLLVGSMHHEISLSHFDLDMPLRYQEKSNSIYKSWPFKGII